MIYIYISDTVLCIFIQLGRNIYIYIYVHVNNYEHAERNGRNSLRVRLDITHASGR